MPQNKKKRVDSALVARVAENIKRLREKNGITKEQLQNMTGITVSRCESGKHDMTLTTLSILSKHLRVEVSDLFK